MTTAIQPCTGDIDLSSLPRRIFTERVPYSEWAGRRREGASVDNQRIETVLRHADIGIMWPLADLSREMLAYNPKAEGIWGKAQTQLAASDYALVAAEEGLSEPEREEANRIANTIRAMLSSLTGWRQALKDLAGAFWDGRAALEIQYERRAGETWPTALEWIQPQRLSFNDKRQLIVVDRWGDYGLFRRRGPALDDCPGKFITFTPRMFNDLQEREGLAPRYLFWLLFDRFQWRHRLLLTEKFGLPWRIIEQEIGKTLAGMKLGLPMRQDGGEGGAPNDDDAALDYTAEEAAKVGEDGTWIGLAGQKLSLGWPPGEVHDFFVQSSDQIMDRLSWLTVHNGINDAPRAAEVVLKMPEVVLYEFRAQLIAEAIQKKFVEILVTLNYCADALPLGPKLQANTKPERDRDKEVERVIKVAGVVPVGAGVMYEASGYRAPNEGEKAISTIALTPTDVGAVLRVDEARAKVGHDPVGGETGSKWVIQHAAAFSAFGTAAGTATGEKVAEPALPNDEGASTDAEVALRELLEDADAEQQADAADGEAQAFARWFAAEGRKVQPRSANGTPEVLVERGVREGARYTTRWAEQIADAGDGTDAAKIYRNLQRAAEALDVEPMARAWERRILHGLMLGGLDAQWEMGREAVVEPVKFAPAAPLVVPGVPEASGIADFVTMPFGDAIRLFRDRRVLTRRAFDRLTAAAKMRAFTVAGLARKEMLATAHDELAKAIATGADLRTFGKALTERFESAGWTRLNPSHVETVFRNGVMNAYSDGRRAQMRQPAVMAARPYWQILGVDDDRTRPTHGKAHGKVLLADDPFFDRAGPPFGHNCRCRTVSRSAADLKRLGLTPTTGAQIDGLPDEGWNTSGSLL